MKKILLILALAFAASAVKLEAQTTTLPAASTPKVTVPWGLPSNCTGTNTCQFQVYRIGGSCPGSLSGSAGWTLLSTTPAQAINFVDSTVIGGTQYSYDVEAVPTGSTSPASGPSNCASVTTLFVPQPPVLGTIISN